MRPSSLLVISIIATLLTSGARADDITLRNGTVYKGAKIVSHDDATAQILYSDGGATVPIDQLPAELQQSLGFDPSKAAAATADTDQQKAFTLAKAKYYLIGDKLVPRAAVTPSPLSFKLLQVKEGHDSVGGSLGQGSYVEVYDVNYTPPPPDPNIPPAMVTNVVTNPDGTITNIVTPVPPPAPVGPGPRDTGSKAFLSGYTGGSLYEITTVQATREGFSKNGDPYYLVVADTFTFDDWLKAGSPK